eukprot:gene2423-biopygen8303
MSKAQLVGAQVLKQQVKEPPANGGPAVPPGSLNPIHGGSSMNQQVKDPPANGGPAGSISPESLQVKTALASGGYAGFIGSVDSGGSSGDQRVKVPPRNGIEMSKAQLTGAQLLKQQVKEPPANGGPAVPLAILNVGPGGSKWDQQVKLPPARGGLAGSHAAAIIPAVQPSDPAGSGTRGDNREALRSNFTPDLARRTARNLRRRGQPSRSSDRSRHAAGQRRTDGRLRRRRGIPAPSAARDCRPVARCRTATSTAFICQPFPLSGGTRVGPLILFGTAPVFAPLNTTRTVRICAKLTMLHASDAGAWWFITNLGMR